MIRHRAFSFLLIFSICMLALKDTASCIHTLLHYLPDNPWHRHEIHRVHTHPLDPLKIHMHLQHTHTHDTHAHVHTHNVLDHIQPEHTSNAAADTAEEIKTNVRIDFYFQPVTDFYAPAPFRPDFEKHFSPYRSSVSEKDVYPPYQPPQL